MSLKNERSRHTASCPQRLHRNPVRVTVQYLLKNALHVGQRGILSAQVIGLSGRRDEYGNGVNFKITSGGSVEQRKSP